MNSKQKCIRNLLSSRKMIRNCSDKMLGSVISNANSFVRLNICTMLSHTPRMLSFTMSRRESFMAYTQRSMDD